MKPNAISFSSGRDLVGYISFWGLLIGFYVFLSIRIDIFDLLLDETDKNGFTAFVVLQVIFGLVFILAAWFFRGTKYIITQDKLIIKIGGFLVDEISIGIIEKASRSFNPLASSATSLKRIMIYKKGNRIAALISPTPERLFLSELLKRNPKIKLKNLKANNGN